MDIVSKSSYGSQGPWRITGRLHFHHVRLEAPKIQLRDARWGSDDAGANDVGWKIHKKNSYCF